MFEYGLPCACPGKTKREVRAACIPRTIWRLVGKGERGTLPRDGTRSLRFATAGPEGREYRLNEATKSRFAALLVAMW